ncbi:unnamed protein product [Linum tenue]|uniref:Gnk2-homologous domain-containing protein n=1 Tax=Linum tenue TaxID=586396 RepID=A0AAV0HR55_9ROSI|nr:unnamed protein product [Linum tenue]
MNSIHLSPLDFYTNFNTNIKIYLFFLYDSNKEYNSVRYDKCFLRYSKTNFVGKLGNSPAVIFFNAENVTDPETFNAKLAGLEDEVRSQAVKPGSKGIGKGETKLLPPSAETIYAVVQCTRDLAAADCGRCLAAAVGYFADYCENKKGCRALLDGCYARYELYPF